MSMALSLLVVGVIGVIGVAATWVATRLNRDSIYLQEKACEIIRKRLEQPPRNIH